MDCILGCASVQNDARALSYLNAPSQMKSTRRRVTTVTRRITRSQCSFVRGGHVPKEPSDHGPLETRIAPGEITQVHTHRWPGVLYVLSFGDFVRRDGDGKVLVDTREDGTLPAPGTAMWSGSLPPHTLENVDTSEIHVIGVELKPG